MTVEERKRAAKIKKIKISAMRWGRITVQILFFIFLPALFSQAFGAVKEIFSAIGKGDVLKSTMFTKNFLILCGLTIVFGRIFCGWACSFGAFGDWIYQLFQLIQKKLNKKLPGIPERITIVLQKAKYIVLLVVLLLCFQGRNSVITKNSPWTVFSLLSVENFSVGSYVTGIVLLLFILIGMIVKERFFCQFLCPLGAIFSLLPEIPLFSLKRNKKQCIPKCSLCKKNCPVGLKLQENESRDGECICCGRCKFVCPKGNISRKRTVNQKGR